MHLLPTHRPLRDVIPSQECPVQVLRGQAHRGRVYHTLERLQLPVASKPVMRGIEGFSAS
jgi:hypothetical protein